MRYLFALLPLGVATVILISSPIGVLAVGLAFLAGSLASPLKGRP